MIQDIFLVLSETSTLGLLLGLFFLIIFLAYIIGGYLEYRKGLKERNKNSHLSTDNELFRKEVEVVLRDEFKRQIESEFLESIRNKKWLIEIYEKEGLKNKDLAYRF